METCTFSGILSLPHVMNLDARHTVSKKWIKKFIDCFAASLSSVGLSLCIQ